MFYCHCNSCFSIKRHTTCYHFKHYDTKGINVAFCIAVTAPCLFRRSIVYRTHGIRCNCFRGCCLCNTKVHDFYFSIFGNHNILRLNVSVYNFIIMSHFQPHGNLNPDTGCFFNSQLSFSFNIIFQCNSFHQFHNNVMVTGFFSYIINIYNVWMCKACCRLCFFFKFTNKVFIFTIFGFQNLNCHKTVQFLVTAFVNH